MALVVQKYGGTSVGNLGKIASVARKVIRTREAGNDVVSRPVGHGRETDRLIKLAQKAADEPDPREYDALISPGEQVTVTLLAIMSQRHGLPKQILPRFSGSGPDRSGLQKGPHPGGGDGRHPG